MTVPPIFHEAFLQHEKRGLKSTAVEMQRAVEPLPALSELLAQTLAVRDVCRASSQHAASLGTCEPSDPPHHNQRRRLELIVSLLERLPLLLGAAVALAELGKDVAPVGAHGSAQLRRF